jgi:hypothetical protein
MGEMKHATNAQGADLARAADDGRTHAIGTLAQVCVCVCVCAYAVLCVCVLLRLLYIKRALGNRKAEVCSLYIPRE